MTAFRTGLLAGLSTSVQVVFAAVSVPVTFVYGCLVMWRKG